MHAVAVNLNATASTVYRNCVRHNSSRKKGIEACASMTCLCGRTLGKMQAVIVRRLPHDILPGSTCALLK